MSMFGFRINECFMQQRARDLNTRKSTKRKQQQKLTIESTALCCRTTEMASSDINHQHSTLTN